jgi:hypothetical protein
MSQVLYLSLLSYLDRRKEQEDQAKFEQAEKDRFVRKHFSFGVIVMISLLRSRPWDMPRERAGVFSCRYHPWVPSQLGHADRH